MYVFPQKSDLLVFTYDYEKIIKEQSSKINEEVVIPKKMGKVKNKVKSSYKGGRNK